MGKIILIITLIVITAKTLEFFIKPAIENHKRRKGERYEP